MEGRQYKNAPITEALVEFRFLQDAEWSWAIPGRMGMQLGGEYSGRERQRPSASLRIGGNAAVAIGNAVDRVLFATPDETRLVGVGENTLSIHALPPYRGWNELRPRAAKALETYSILAPQAQVERVGVRYINTISIPAADLRQGLSKFVATGAPLPSEIDAAARKFVNRWEAEYGDGATITVTTSASAVNGKDVIKLVVDLDVFRGFPTGISPAQVMEIVDELHRREGAAFEAVVTDHSREVFDR